ncbi:MAG TPA: 4Fe-4S dicluster domain-containing protein [Anaerolineae bacterium]|nr:4Fe-4S dicluster domain-containing protein [Anaerolineae bacterium]
MPVVQEMENAIVRMLEDLQRALQKPPSERRWGMVIDLTKCVDCNACTVSCKAENKTPPGVNYTVVIKEEVGTYPNVREMFLPRPCMHCENPPCVHVCPVHATWQNEEGVVVIDYDACIGCRYCITACPYGARTFDFGDWYTEGTPMLAPYETVPTFEYGEERVRREDESPVGNVRKCHFCLHRVHEGLLPACINDCIGRARYFGDLNDPDSLVSELLRERYSFRLKEELGTHPKVFYLS